MSGNEFELTLRDGILIVIGILALTLAVFISDYKTEHAIQEMREEVQEQCPELLKPPSSQNNTINTANELEVHWYYNESS